MISVIISVYKSTENLHLIFIALANQIFKDFEVIVSEDNNGKEMVDFLERVKSQFDFKIKHVSQEDIGFRKTRILNLAIQAAAGNILVFLDGDCVPHKKLLARYNELLTPSTVAIGRRCYLNEKITKKLLSSQDPSVLSSLSILFNTRRLKHAFYIPWMRDKLNTSRKIIGCNWAVYKQSLLDINGYDEDYNRPGRGEDFDVDWRLRKSGLIINNIKHKVITYHLFHHSNHDINDAISMENLMQKKISEGSVFCKNGIIKR